ncbi:MAG: tRNA threonylcarbamoyladenosine dehydratase [Saprospiraceae bacterium]|nr:tRNA threonylcarbamoyladenosine dehydratase [Saprospiraceae bacterium]
MVPQWLQRSELLIGEENIEKLSQANVIIVGLGGVGSYAAEFIARAGVGNMTIVDGDVVDITNTNRQLPALASSVGKSKAECMQQRLLDINPSLKLTVISDFLDPEMAGITIKEGNFDYVMDCIDSVSPKQYLIKSCVENDLKIISSMGAGGRLDPQKVRLSRLDKTYNCPFAHQIRKGLRKKQINLKKVMTVFSHELVKKENMTLTDGTHYKKSYYGTISYIPALFGLNMASYVIRDIIGR